MRRRAYLLLLLLWSGAVPAQDRAGLAREVRLEVKPVLCILDRRTSACDMQFLIDWRSSLLGDYCLFGEGEAPPLRCWQDDVAGRHETRRRVDERFDFWLSDGLTGEPLDAVTVEVLSTDTGDRRRRRRSRHVWDVL